MNSMEITAALALSGFFGSLLALYSRQFFAFLLDTLLYLGQFGYLDVSLEPCFR
jgi:hypothetical protein